MNYITKMRSDSRYRLVVLVLLKVIGIILIGDNIFTLGTLAKTAKRYAFNPSISDEAFLNAFLEPYVVAGRVKRRGNLEFELDKHRTSEILNGKCDVPVDLRKVIARFGLEEEMADRFDVFFSESMDSSLFALFMDEIVDCLDEKSEADMILREQLFALSGNPCSWMAHVLLAAIRADNRDITERALWRCGTGSLYVRKGDLFANCFSNGRSMRRIVVIPVNTTFDTKITWAYENDPKPLVSAESIHGQWLRRMIGSGMKRNEIDNCISESLHAQGAEPVAVQKRGTSPKPEYPIGTIAVVPRMQTVFYLLAISVFDVHNNAKSTREQISVSLESLIAFYDSRGQGLDLFLPLMGTGLSRASLTHQESYDLIVSIISEKKSHIHGRMTVVVRKDDAKEVCL